MSTQGSLPSTDQPESPLRSFNVPRSATFVSQVNRSFFTWAWKSTPERESLVTVEIKPDGDGSLLTLTHEQFFDEEARDRHRSGWTAAPDKFETFVA